MIIKVNNIQYCTIISIGVDITMANNNTIRLVVITLKSYIVL